MLEAFLSAGRIRPGPRAGDVRSPEQAGFANSRRLHLVDAQGQYHRAVGAHAAAAPGAVARADAVHLEGLGARHQPVCRQAALVAAHGRVAARARAEDLVAQGGNFSLFQPLGVDQQRPQLGGAQLVDALPAPLRDPAAWQDA